MLSNSEDNFSDDHSIGHSDVPISELEKWVTSTSDTDTDGPRDLSNRKSKISSRKRTPNHYNESVTTLKRSKLLNDSTSEDDDDDESYVRRRPAKRGKFNMKPKKSYISNKRDIPENIRSNAWSWEPNKEDESILENGQYRTVKAAGEHEISVENFVTLRTANNNNYVGEIMYMFEDAASKVKFAHCRWYIFSRDTILGEDGIPNEIFQLEKCNDIRLSSIGSVYPNVKKYANNESLTWKDFRNMYENEQWKNAENKGDTLFCKHRYDTSSGYFRTLYKDVKQGCYVNCENIIKKDEEVPTILGDYTKQDEDKNFPVYGFVWCGETYTVGSCLFTDPGILTQGLSSVRKHEAPEYPLSRRYNEDKYPELYRKVLSNRDYIPGPCNPFEVSAIEEIVATRNPIKSVQDLVLTCRRFYRPENMTLKNQIDISSFDQNVLFWSCECAIGPIVDTIQGKCYVVYEGNIGTDKDEWASGGPNRFYFSKGYDQKEKKLFPLMESASGAKQMGIYEGDGIVNKPKDWPKISHPLDSLDIFAGCGSLTEGLHQSGAVNCKWAIEVEKVAASSFKKNFPKVDVLDGDCEEILRMTKGNSGKLKRGQVEMIYGRLPRRSYTRVSRDERANSHFENSRVMPFLSLADYLRPRFFLLENVKGFVGAGKGSVVRGTIKTILKMGYQVGLAVLQCGSYGIAQSRESTIILAAAPGDILPSHPELSHMFMNDPYEKIKINGIEITPEVKWRVSAPYRRITVRDAISELPQFDHYDERSMRYGSTAKTHFQRMIRGETKQGKDDELLYHQSKKLTPLVQARIDRLPQSRKGLEDVDWRNLPNKKVKLSNGKNCFKLKYKYGDVERGKAKNGSKRGVCECAMKTKEERKYSNHTTSQKDTLIPWCLPHTSDRHKQWPGLYGRIGWDYHFKTVVTNPEPMGEHGRVIHPELNRVVTVRENARAQGFPDKFVFEGTIPQKYAQVAKSVPPPLGRAIGLEIRKCIAAKEAVGV